MQCDFENMKNILKNGIKTVQSDQLFATPAHIVTRMVDLLDVREGMKILEPSAGTGALIRALPDNIGLDITAVEVNADLCARLIGLADNVFNKPFEEFTGRENYYDIAIMNPPFSNGRDIKHILHALEMVKEGGQLVAICANGARQAATLQPLATAWIELPEGAFKSSGTNVRTVLILINK